MQCSYCSREASMFCIVCGKPICRRHSYISVCAKEVVIHSREPYGVDDYVDNLPSEVKLKGVRPLHANLKKDKSIHGNRFDFRYPWDDPLKGK